MSYRVFIKEFNCPRKRAEILFFPLFLVERRPGEALAAAACAIMLWVPNIFEINGLLDVANVLSKSSKRASRFFSKNKDASYDTVPA